MTRRDTTEGPVVGFSEANGSYTWMGIPYAAAPVGDRRWKAPVNPPQRDRERIAVRAGAFCPQIGNPSVAVEEALHGQVVGSEDCLFLNIWAPPAAPEQIADGAVRLPVMFWIHGGGNSIGEGHPVDQVKFRNAPKLFDDVGNKLNLIC